MKDLCGILSILLLAVQVFGQTEAALVLSKNKSQEKAAKKEAPAQVIPIQVMGNALLVEAQIGDQKGFFLLDTGAPGLVVNHSAQEKQVAANSLSQEFMVADTIIRDFRWQDDQWKNLSALAIDLSQMKAARTQPLMGLIGYDILRRYDEIVIDPVQGTLNLNDAGEKASSELPLAVVPMKQENHLPVVEARLNGTVLKLGIDTGTESNMIDSRKLSAFAPEQYRKLGQDNVRGLDQSVRSQSILQFNTLQIGGLLVENATFTEIDLSHLSPDMAIDGILGSNFLNQFKYAINFRKKIFQLWALPSDSLPN